MAYLHPIALFQWLADRIIGYNGYEIGCLDMLFNVDNNTEEEAIKLINEM